MGMACLPAAWYASCGDPSTLPQSLQDELRAAKDIIMAPNYDDAAPCMWLDLETRRCRNYEHRPEVCREAVKPGDEHCRHDRKKFGIDPNPRYRLRGGRIVRSA